MRIAPLVLLVAACGGHPAPGTLPVTQSSHNQAPAADLKNAPPARPADDAHLPVKDPRVTDLDVIRIRAIPGTGPGADPQMETTSTTELFNAATAAVKAGRTEEALTAFKQLVYEFPDSGLAPVEMFDIAAILDGRGDWEQTITALRELVEKYPQARESIDGHLYIAALQAEHARWADTIATVDALLAREHLTYADRLEAEARKGYVQIELGRIDDADATLDTAIGEWRNAPHIDDPFYIAMATYYKGEVAHERFLHAPVRLPDDQMVKDLDAKRALVVSAYDEWRDSLDFKQGYWSTAAGYQMSQIFVELWEATVKAPWPQRVDTATRSHYLTELHDRERKNLEKALEGHNMNVELAKAYGIDTPWSRGSAEQAAKILELLQQEAAGRYVTP